MTFFDEFIQGWADFWSASLGEKLPTGFLERVVFLISQYGMSFLRGAGWTFVIALVGTAIGFLIGLICGIVQTIPVTPKNNIVYRIFMKIVHTIIYIYVEVFRGTPMMVQAMVIYYGAFSMGIQMTPIFAGFFIVSINTGAYMAETMRGGIYSVDVGQTEGAKALGMSHFSTMLRVILPQAVRNIMPQIGNNLIINIKDTSVLNVIGVVELYFATKSVSGAYYTYFEAFSITLVIYLVMTVTCSRILRLLERKIDGADSYDLSTTDTLAHTSGLHSPTIPAGRGRLRGSGGKGAKKHE